MRKDMLKPSKNIETEKPIMSATYSTRDGFIEVLSTGSSGELYVLLDALLMVVIPKICKGSKFNLSNTEKIMFQQMIDSRKTESDLLELIMLRLEGNYK